MAETRWAKTIATKDPMQTRTLRREDLLEYLQKIRAFLAVLDEGESDFAEAKAKGIDFEDFRNDLRYDPKVLAACREILSIMERYHRLLDENWADFEQRGVEPADGQLEPWQTEAIRLDREQASLVAKLKELSLNLRRRAR